MLNLRLVMLVALWCSAVATPVGQIGTLDPPVLVGAGDIASCDLESDSATADLLDNIQGTVFTLGDNVYDHGSAKEFAECYDPTWGRHKARTYPAAGNHEYETEDATAYFAYFGAAAGEAGQGYYSYDLGTWHIVVLNSNCHAIGGCGPDSEQAAWLRADLEGHPTECTLAYWHHPRFSSGPDGDTLAMAHLWAVLYEFEADVVLAGHDHRYERFAPQDAAGRADSVSGIRQFVVGTGGASLYDAYGSAPNSEVQNSETFGVLKLTLHPDRYDWHFIPTVDGGFNDEGVAACH